MKKQHQFKVVIERDENGFLWHQCQRFQDATRKQKTLRILRKGYGKQYPSVLKLLKMTHGIENRRDALHTNRSLLA